MKLIQTNEQLLQFIPNILQTVKGEKPLYDKISVHLDLAEDWVRDTFTSDKTLNAIADHTEDNPIRITLQRLIVAEALHKAIANLDLVVTPTVLPWRKPPTSCRHPNLASTAYSRPCSPSVTTASPDY